MTLALFAPALAQRPDPAYATNITVYHINPHPSGAIPVNSACQLHDAYGILSMAPTQQNVSSLSAVCAVDTGNGVGDLFFDLFEVLIFPLACKQGAQSGHTCSNPEAHGSNLVVNKLVLEVDNRYSDYAMCNIGVNGTDGHKHKCTDGTYCCFCHKGFWPEQCKATLGRENLVDHFGGGGGHHHGFQCREGQPSYYCYMAAVFSKLNTSTTPAFWYSSLKSGYCDGASGECTWRVVSVDKIVSRDCHSKVFGDIVQATQPAAACLDGCGAQATNTSSPCWSDCFYQAAMGPTSGVPGGKVGGMTLSDLTAAWEKPFAPEAEGGCPALAPMTPWFETPAVEAA